jgi:hypothetical protein
MNKKIIAIPPNVEKKAAADKTTPGNAAAAAAPQPAAPPATSLDKTILFSGSAGSQNAGAGDAKVTREALEAMVKNLFDNPAPPTGIKYGKGHRKMSDAISLGLFVEQLVGKASYGRRAHEVTEPDYHGTVGFQANHSKLSIHFSPNGGPVIFSTRADFAKVIREAFSCGEEYGIDLQQRGQRKLHGYRSSDSE